MRKRREESGNLEESKGQPLSDMWDRTGDTRTPNEYVLPHGADGKGDTIGDRSGT